MSWIKHKTQEPIVLSVAAHMARQKGRLPAPHIDRETEQLLAAFLIKHGRLAAGSGGRHALHLLGTLKNADDTIDYSVRTMVRMANGATQRFDSHIREYPDGTRRMRLIR